jgi:hypothetical protein
MRPKLTFSSPLPDEPVIFYSNHANDFGPGALVTAFTREFRSWISANMLKVKTAPAQIMKTTLPNFNKFTEPFLRLLSFGMGVALSVMFKAAGAIPVFHDLRLKTTFTKTAETLKEGLDVVIFPDSLLPNPGNPYIDKMQKGAFRILTYLKRCNLKVPPVYPVYACKALKTVLVGNPIRLEDGVTEDDIYNHVDAEIKRLGESLPPHKIQPYAVMPKDISKIRKYFTVGDEKIYDELEELQKTAAQSLEIL